MLSCESVYVRSPGATLAVRHYAGSGDPIVLLHGGPGMGDYFDTLPEMLSPRRVIRYDQRGCGKSLCDGSFDVDKQIADLDAIRAHFGAARIHLFGHSWGGLLGQLYAKARPDRVASLVLCCSMANTGRNVAKMESKGIAERVIGRKKRTLGWLAAGTMMQLPGRLGDVGFGFVMQQLLPHYVVHPERAPKHFDVNRASKRAWRGTGKSIREIPEDYLTRMAFDAPVLIVQGERDVIRETNPLLAERFPGATNVRIPDTAHFPWVEEPQMFSKTLLDFYGSAT